MTFFDNISPHTTNTPKLAIFVFSNSELGLGGKTSGELFYYTI